MSCLLRPSSGQGGSWAQPLPKVTWEQGSLRSAWGPAQPPRTAGCASWANAQALDFGARPPDQHILEGAPSTGRPNPGPRDNAAGPELEEAPHTSVCGQTGCPSSCDPDMQLLPQQKGVSCFPPDLA